MAQRVFYNLVHTEYSTRRYKVTTVKLVKYQMDPKFEESYYAGNEGVANFAGIITFTPLTASRDLLPPEPGEPVPPEEISEPEPPAEPCEEETVIVVPPRSGGSGGSLGGGNGGGFSGLYEAFSELPRSGCWEWVVKKCSHNIHVGNVPRCDGTNEGNCCEGSFIGSTSLVNHCNGISYNAYGRNETVPTVTDPCEPVGEIGVLGPLPPKRLSHQKNCEELKKLSQNSAVKEGFEDMTRPDKLHSDQEHAKSMRKQPDGETSVFDEQPGVPGENSVEFKTGGKIFGGMHTHSKGLNGYPMFSADDVETLYMIAKNYFTWPDDPTDTPEAMRHVFVFTATTLQGTYAIKIDAAEFMTIMQPIYDNPTKFRNYLLNEQRKGPINAVEQTHQSIFLNFLKNYNLPVSLYKASSDLNTWTKLEIDPKDRNKVISKNCN